jgi:hypothetical protein
MAIRNSERAPKAPSPASPVADSDLSWLVAALKRGQSLDPSDILPALEELQRAARRGMVATARPASVP